MSIEVTGMAKRFNGFTAVDHVTFGVGDGEFVSLLGPSGSGKSTILRAIAGLEVPDEGRIAIDDVDVTGVPPQDRGVGFVFQHYALFRHMTVLENIGFGLRVRGIGRIEREEKARQLLGLVGMGGFENRLPMQLSGGQRQRVALARALAPEPKLLLLDEPFGALDTRLRKELRAWLLDLHDRIRLTTLLVTHDQDEALELSDRILVVNRGRIEQEATPQTIFENPATEFVARFVGETNRIEAVVEEKTIRWGGLSFRADRFENQASVALLFRPHDVYVSSLPESGSVRGRITGEQFLGAQVAFAVTLESGDTIVAQMPQGVAAQSGFSIGGNVHIAVTRYHLFRREPG